MDNKEYNALDKTFIKENEKGEKELTKEGIKILLLVAIFSPIIIIITKIKYAITKKHFK